MGQDVFGGGGCKEKGEVTPTPPPRKKTLWQADVVGKDQQMASAFCLVSLVYKLSCCTWATTSLFMSQGTLHVIVNTDV